MNPSDAMIEYSFAGFRLDPRCRKLFDAQGEAITLSSRAMDTLLVLLEQRGETISKADLMQAVWPNLCVEENNLNQAISTLRKALGDSKKNNTGIILTVPGRGYCFAAPVEVSTPSSTPAAVAPAAPPQSAPARVFPAILRRPGKMLGAAAACVIGLAAAAGILLFRDIVPHTPQAGSTALPAAEVSATQATHAPIRNSIAVLPFTNLNPASDNELFALGLHDEVINHLSKIHSLNVIARDSVLTLVQRDLPMHDLSRLLRVESMLSGTVLFADDRARISLQMLDAHTGITLWSHTYEASREDLSEMIAIQSDIAVNVAHALEAEIKQSERRTLAAMPTASFEAYRYNLAAKNAHLQQDFATEWELAYKAVQLDPDYFDALHTWSSVNTVLVGHPLPGMSSRKHFDLALQGAERIIEIAPQRSEGYSLKAVALAANKDWSGVAAMLEKLEQMDVPLAELKFVSLVMLSLGDFDKAIEIYEANLIIEPINLYGRGFLMAAHELAGNREQAREEYAIGDALSPLWWGDAVNIFLALGRAEPLRDVEQLAGISDELKQVLLNIHDEVAVAAGLHAFHTSAHKISAETLYYGAIAAYTGRPELAVALMRMALVDVWTSLYWLWLPVFDEVRQLESFKALLEESGIVGYWREQGWPAICQPEAESFTCNWSAYPRH